MACLVAWTILQTNLEAKFIFLKHIETPVKRLQFTDDIFKSISLKNIFDWLIFHRSLLQTVINGSMDNKASLVQVMAWRAERPPAIYNLNQWWPRWLPDICVTRQYVDSLPRYAVEPLYSNMCNIYINIIYMQHSWKTLHNSPMRVRYDVSFVSWYWSI